jgi:hypothetical protein
LFASLIVFIEVLLLTLSLCLIAIPSCCCWEQTRSRRHCHLDHESILMINFISCLHRPGAPAPIPRPALGECGRQHPRGEARAQLAEGAGKNVNNNNNLDGM